MSNKHRPDLFVHTLNTMDYGVTPEELSDSIAELLQAVQDTNKKGTLTLKLTVKPESINAGQISITPDIKLTAPKYPRDKALMFLTPENNLQREDPRQTTMEFKTVESSQKQPMAAIQETAPSTFKQAQ
jgi:hypothetical protein